MNPHAPNRREFLQAGVAGLAAAGLAGAAEPPQTNAGGIPLRPLGKTGEMVTILGLGGHHSTRHPDEKDSIRLIQRAVDEGITFLDNAWDYHDGAAEERMGKALAEGGRRDKVFLMTKCCGRTAKDAQANLEDSLRRLQDRPPRPLAVPRDHLRQRPRLDLRGRRRHRDGAEGPEAGQGPLPRLHRPQGPGDPPQDARQAVRLGHRPDAPERHGRPLPQLPAPGPARAR